MKLIDYLYFNGDNEFLNSNYLILYKNRSKINFSSPITNNTI